MARRVCVCVFSKELYPLLTQNSFGLKKSNSFVALPPIPAPCRLLLFFLGSQVPLLAGEPTTPAQSWPRYRDGLERWAWAMGEKEAMAKEGNS